MNTDTEIPERDIRITDSNWPFHLDEKIRVLEHDTRSLLLKNFCLGSMKLVVGIKSKKRVIRICDQIKYLRRKSHFILPDIRIMEAFLEKRDLVSNMLKGKIVHFHGTTFLNLVDECEYSPFLCLFDGNVKWNCVKTSVRWDAKMVSVVIVT